MEGTRSARLAPVLLALLVFTSGATSLGFEVVWSKQLAVVLGGTTSGIAFVVAVFMGGMMLGYFAGGRIAARIDRPVAAYGLCEIGLALFALLAVQVAPTLDDSVSVAAAYLFAGALLLPCTFLAGVTLPLLIEGTRGSVGASLGLLYGINTLGAVCGVIVTGMLLIGRFGLQGSAWILASVGVGVGVLAILLGRSWKRPSDDAAASVSRSEPGTAAHDRASSARWALLALCVGVASLAEEVIWARALIPQLNSSTYAFSAILAVFLLGLALGAQAAGRLMARGADPVAWLVGTQLAAGLLVLSSPEALMFAERTVVGYVGVRQVSDMSTWLSVMWTALARAGMALLLPTLMLGFALPLLAELYARSTAARARAVGVLAGMNTLGAVVGSLAARFLFLPNLGVSGSLRALALLHAAIALVSLSSGARKPLWIAACALLAGVAVASPSTPPFLGRLVQGHQLVLVDEGVQDTTAVIEIAGTGGMRQIVSNGIAYAGDTPAAKRYMRMLAHLPALIARRQQRALVICMGTGMTAAAVARHPAFAQLDFVDISPVVFRTLPLFDRANDRVYRDPRGRFHIEDGRVFMAHASPGSYDVITLEPPPPRVAGVAALYSREFYEHAKRALAPGGALAQWLPIHGMTNDELRMLARTFTDVFPDAIMVEVQHVEAALIGLNGEGAPEATRLQRMLQPGVAQHLSELGIRDPWQLPKIEGPALVQALGPGPIVTDDHPRIEHFAAGLPEHGTSTDLGGQAFLDQLLGVQRASVAPH
jgi:spermidine synthase